ncbi:MAG: hypothetical protein IT204_17885 [Fimbriimonadaceae bacterium]|nr:hypothetical protein [Fimbriimonadaceae bacterium]
MMPLFMPVDEWMQAFTPPFDNGIRTLLQRLYGPDSAVWTERCRLLRQALGTYREHYGSGPVLISRSPSRLSFNPHSDHQGSFVLYGCHTREILLVVGWRDDQQFHVSNAAPEFASGLSFDLDSEVARAPEAWEAGWVEYIDTPDVKAAVGELKDRKNRPAGRTGTLNYIKGALLRMAHERPGEVDHGLNMLIAGDIHYGAGMSSSSAIVVATALAANAIYHLGLQPKELVRLLGEAEWYVGTRGGSGDQAAMLLGERGKLTNIQFIPPLEFRDLRSVEFPSGYQVLVVNSGMRAEKSSAEKRMFNRGVFAYKFAYAEMRRALEEHHRAWNIASEVVAGTHWLADFNTSRIALPRIYDLLLAIPEHCALSAVQQRYPEAFAQLAQSFFDTTDLAELPESIPLRGAALYGIGRADRGMVQDQLLANGSPEAMAEFGLLTSITHDGDRLFAFDAAGHCQPYDGHHQRLSDAHLRQLAAAAVKRGTPEYQAARLRRQPGFYGASIRQLDQIVDLVTPLDGVLGAGLMGAGGGGVVLVVAQEGDEIESRLRQTLVERYYEPAGLAPDVDRWQPAQGATVLNVFGELPARAV